MFIQKKPPRAHALGEPLLHENHHASGHAPRLPAAGLISAPAMVHGAGMAGRAAEVRARANAAIAAGHRHPGAAGGQPVQRADRRSGGHSVHLLRPRRRREPGRLRGPGRAAGRAAELPVDRRLRQAGRAGQHGADLGSTFISSALGLLWHSDGAILRGITVARPRRRPPPPDTNGAVICAHVAERHRQQSAQSDVRHRDGDTRATPRACCSPWSAPVEVSGGNSAAPMQRQSTRPCSRPRSPSPAMPPAWSAPAARRADPVAVAVLESQARISSGTGLYDSAQCPMPRAPSPAR